MRGLDNCCTQVPDYDLTSLSLCDRHKLYCSRCFNGFIANTYGIEFELRSFDPVILCNLDGIPHTFSFRTLLLRTHISIEAFEMTDERGGYAFQMEIHDRSETWQGFPHVFLRPVNSAGTALSRAGCAPSLQSSLPVRELIRGAPGITTTVGHAEDCFQKKSSPCTRGRELTRKSIIPKSTNAALTEDKTFSNNFL
jgi:hypothetical protein